MSALSAAIRKPGSDLVRSCPTSRTITRKSPATATPSRNNGGGTFRPSIPLGLRLSGTRAEGLSTTTVFLYALIVRDKDKGQVESAGHDQHAEIRARRAAAINFSVG